VTLALRDQAANLAEKLVFAEEQTKEAEREAKRLLQFQQVDSSSRFSKVSIVACCFCTVANMHSPVSWQDEATRYSSEHDAWQNEKQAMVQQHTENLEKLRQESMDQV
jgi:hypothetical protein